MKKIELNKILVPIDFSNNSIRAMKMAAGLAAVHHSEIHLLHVSDNDFDLFDPAKSCGRMDMMESAERLKVFADSIIQQFALACTYSVAYGGVAHSILKTAMEMHAGLITMGKNGSNGVLQDYAGSQTCQLAEKSAIPLLIVPDCNIKYCFQNILLPLRAVASTLETYEAAKPFLLKSKPVITLLNMRDPAAEGELQFMHRLTMQMRTKLLEDKIPYKAKYYFKDKHFAEAVLTFMKEKPKPFDLLVVITSTHKPGADFHLEYFAQKIIHSCNIPSIIVHTENPVCLTTDFNNYLETGIFN